MRWFLLFLLLGSCSRGITIERERVVPLSPARNACVGVVAGRDPPTPKVAYPDAVAFSLDGALLATAVSQSGASSDHVDGAGGVYLDRVDGVRVTSFRLHASSIRFVAPRRLLVWGTDAGVLDIDTGCFVALGVARDVALDPSRGLLLADGTQLARRLLAGDACPGCAASIASEAIAVDLRSGTLATLEGAHEVVLRDPITLGERARHGGGGSNLSNAQVIAVRPDGRVIAAGDARCVPTKPRPGTKPAGPMCGTSIVLIDDAAKELARFDADPYAMAWSPDGAKLAYGSAGLLATYAPITGKSVTFASTGWFQGVAWSPDGSKLAGAAWDGAVHVYEANGTPLRTLKF